MLMMRRIGKLGLIVFMCAVCLWLLYLNFLMPRWRYIIIHHSATDLGSAKIFWNGHEARGGAWPGNDAMLYHLVIGNGRGSDDGVIEAGTRWRCQQFGGGCASVKGWKDAKSFPEYLKAASDYYNYTGIHICLVGNIDKQSPTRRQLAALSMLVNDLCRRYNIPHHAVIGHREAQIAPTGCPGKRFPLAVFRRQTGRNLHLGRGRTGSGVVTWKVRIINLWPVLGLFFGEYYYSLSLLILDIMILAGLWRLLAGVRRKPKEPDGRAGIPLQADSPSAGHADPRVLRAFPLRNGTGAGPGTEAVDNANRDQGWNGSNTQYTPGQVEKNDER